MNYFKEPVDERLMRYDHLIVHCTATAGNRNDIDAEWVDDAHKKKNWSGCGYHAVITRDGEIQMHDTGFKARPVNKQGSHVGACGRGWNGRSLGVSLAGGVNEDNQPENNFTKEQFDSLANYIESFLESHPNPESVKVMGHRDLIKLTRSSPKACPCFDVSEFMQDRRLNVGDEDQDPTNDSSILSIPESYEVKGGDSLWKIAQLFGISVSSLRAKNNLSDDTIHLGQKLAL